MQEIPVQIRIPTRCRHVAQSDRHPHRRQDGAQGHARGGVAVPDPQTQEIPLLHGPGRQVLPNLLARDFEAEGPMAAGDRRHRIQGGRHQAPTSRPWSTSYNDEVVAYSISRSPNMKMVLEMLAASRAGSMAKMPVAAFGQGSAAPDARLQARAERWESPSPCPAKETASTTRRPRTSRWSRPSFTTIGRETTPISSERDLEKYIDWYNNVRIKRRLDGSSPVEYIGRAA